MCCVMNWRIVWRMIRFNVLISLRVCICLVCWLNMHQTLLHLWVRVFCDYGTDWDFRTKPNLVTGALCSLFCKRSSLIATPRLMCTFAVRLAVLALPAPPSPDQARFASRRCVAPRDACGQGAGPLVGCPSVLPSQCKLTRLKRMMKRKSRIKNRRTVSVWRITNFMPRGRRKRIWIINGSKSLKSTSAHNSDWASSQAATGMRSFASLWPYLHHSDRYSDPI